LRVITRDLWGAVLEGRATEAASVDAMVAAIMPVGALISVESEATSSVEMDDCVPRWHAAGGAENAPMDWIRKSAAKGRYFPPRGAIRLVTAQALRRPPRAIPHPRVRVNVNSAPKRMHARAATVARTTAVAPHQSPTSLASRRRIAVAPPSRSLAQVRGRAGRSAALVTRAAGTIQKVTKDELEGIMKVRHRLEDP
jgi:hypothetical protein